MQHLGQGPVNAASGHTKVGDLGGVGGGVGGSVVICFLRRGLSTQNAEFGIHNAELSAHHGEFRCAVLGGSGSRDCFMVMALWKLF